MIEARHLSKFLLVLTLALAACGGGTGDSGGPPPPPPGNDGGNMVSFAQDIQPIFNSRCTTSCHDSTTANGGLDLSAPGSYQHLVNAPVSAACSAAVPNAPPRVTPGDPMGSMLWRKTKPDPSRCLSQMPFGTAGLGVISPAQFAKIEAWIQQGALNN
jgi:hypothetical protein